MKKTSLTLTIILIAATVSHANTLAHWEFSGNANDSAGTNHGTLENGAATVFDTERSDDVLTLDGTDDYVSIGDQDVLDFGSDDSFSVSAWVKTTQTTTSSIMIVDKRCWEHDSGYGHYREGYSIGVRDHKAFFAIEDTTNSGGNLFGTTIVNDGLWHHIIGVRDTTTDMMYLYVDETLEASASDPTVGSLAGDWPLSIGRYKAAEPGPEYRYFDGMIDEVQIFDYAVPEPATIILLSLGGLILRKKKVS